MPGLRELGLFYPQEGQGDDGLFGVHSSGLVPFLVSAGIRPHGGKITSTVAPVLGLDSSPAWWG